MQYEVYRSAPVKTIMTKPTGKTAAEIVRSRPAIWSELQKWSWSHRWPYLEHCEFLVSSVLSKAVCDFFETILWQATYLVWNHGEAFVESDKAQPNDRRAPPMNELTNILSSLILAFLAPIRETFLESANAFQDSGSRQSCGSTARKALLKDSQSTKP
jgi:hypothetical protein